MARTLTWFGSLVLVAGLAGGCAKNSSSPSSPDGSTSRRDTGTQDNTSCGDLGDRCCSDDPKCRGGEDQALCRGGTCCAVPNGARCNRSSDCCNGRTCGRNGRCCRDSGDRCESSAECCDGVCTSAGVCGTEECDYRDCDQCLENGCGWCNGGCRAGDSGGPDSGSCSGWLFGSGDASSCPDATDCASASSCDACIQSEGSCGWCGDGVSDGICEPGLTGSDDDMNCRDTWNWTATDCDRLEAHCTATDCMGCLDQAGCGWCNSTGRCQGDQGTCSDWADLDSECDAGSNSCTETTCEGCIHDNCGWCGSSNTSGTCKPGTSSQPDDGSCSSNWVWSRSSCNGGSSTTCSGSTCETCAASSGCGWCSDGSGSCVEGTRSGSSNCSALGWTYDQVDCGATTTGCSSATNCGDCNSRSGCGWCADDNRCRPTSESSSCSTRGWKDSTVECCESHSGSCSACTDLLPCGWCESTNSCMEGSSTQSDSGSCSGSNWVWNNSDCDGGGSTTCSRQVTESCSSDSQCCDSPSVNLSCREGVTFSTRCCVEQGSDCTSSSQCCGWMICTGPGSDNQCACQGQGENCLDDRDCCSPYSCSPVSNTCASISST